MKAVDQSGGYGMLIGPPRPPPSASEFRRLIEAEPRELHRPADDRALRHPTFVDGGLHGCHVDLRPFVLCGADGVRIVPGGLTRMALREGLARRQLVAGRRQQGHLGAAR